MPRRRRQRRAGVGRGEGTIRIPGQRARVIVESSRYDISRSPDVINVEGGTGRVIHEGRVPHEHSGRVEHGGTVAHEHKGRVEHEHGGTVRHEHGPIRHEGTVRHEHEHRGRIEHGEVVHRGKIRFGRVRHEGTINLVGGGGGRGGGRGPVMPAFDYDAQRRRILGMINAKQTQTRLFLGGQANYERFIREGKYRSGPTEAAMFPRPADFAGTTVGIKGVLKPRLVVKTVAGGGKVGLLPWNENFFLYHPFRTATNVIRWLKNPLTRKAEQRELGLSGEAKDEARLEHISLVQRKYEQILGDALEQTRNMHAQLEQSYRDMGEGRITPEEFNLQRERFLQQLMRFDRELNRGNILYERGRKKLATNLAKAREKRGI